MSANIDLGRDAPSLGEKVDVGSGMIGFALLATLCLSLGSYAYPSETAFDATALTARFQEIALRLTRDATSDRSRAVDLYWDAYELADRSGERDALERSLGKLYAQLHSAHIARVTFGDSRLEQYPPTGALLVTRGEVNDSLLLVVNNETSDTQIFTIYGRSKAGVTITKASLSIEGHSYGATFVKMVGQSAGPFLVPLHIRSREKAAIVMIRGDVREEGRLVVHLFDPSGHATAARVFLNGADGMSRSSKGSVDRVMWISGEHFFYADGVLRTDLPAGKATIEVVQGFDSLPIRAEVTIQPHKTVRLALSLRRLEDMNAHGWYSGDDHIHANYLGEQWVLPRDALLVIRAEDLNVGNFMVSNSSGSQVHDEQYFEGKVNPESVANHLMYWNEELRNDDFYGHLILLNLRKLVRPIYTGFPGTPNWEDYPSSYRLLQTAKEQGGFTAYAHPAHLFDQIPLGSGARASVADVALGAVDAFEVFSTTDEPSLEVWYKFLNCGFKLGITAGSDAMLNELFTTLAGGERIYVQTGHDFSYSKWVQGLKEGKSFATVGPLLFVKVEDQDPGHEFHFDHSPARLKASARVSSFIPISRLEIVVNGKVVTSVANDVPTHHLRWAGTISVDRSAWVGARVWGPKSRLIADGPSTRWSRQRRPRVLMAHTSPFYVYIGTSPIFSEEDRSFLLSWMDTLIASAKKGGIFASEKHRQDVLDNFLRARAIYERMGKQGGKSE